MKYYVLMASFSMVCGNHGMILNLSKDIPISPINGVFWHKIGHLLVQLLFHRGIVSEPENLKFQRTIMANRKGFACNCPSISGIQQ